MVIAIAPGAAAAVRFQGLTPDLVPDALGFLLDMAAAREKSSCCWERPKRVRVEYRGMKDVFVRSVRRIRRSDLIDALNIEVARLRSELDQKLAEARSDLAVREQAHLEFAALRDGQLAQLKRDLSDRREVAKSLVREVDRVRSERDALAERMADREALLARARSELVQLTVERDALAAKEIGLRAEAVRLDQERAAALGTVGGFPHTGRRSPDAS